MHPSPIADFRDIIQRRSYDLIEKFRINVIDENLSWYCPFGCAKELKVLSRNNSLDLGPCPMETRRQFFEAYKNDDRMSNVDLFFVSNTASLAELFMPFNRSIIINLSQRYEYGRWNHETWTHWTENLLALAKDPRSILVSNNMYDSLYTQYFTGLIIPVVPSLCRYTHVRWEDPRASMYRHNEFIIGPSRVSHITPELMQEIQKSVDQRNDELYEGDDELVLVTLRDIYPQFKYMDLVKHRAMVCQTG